MNKLTACIAVTLVSMSQPSLSQTAPPVVNGNQMAEWCLDDGEFGEIACMFYISGFRQGAEMESIMQKRPPKFCVPHNVTNEQLSRTFSKFLREYPEHRHLPAPGLVYMMAATYYACPEGR